MKLVIEVVVVATPVLLDDYVNVAVTADVGVVGVAALEIDQHVGHVDAGALLDRSAHHTLRAILLNLLILT